MRERKIMSIEKAMIFAQAAHAGQIRKFSKLPYFLHLQSVANMVQCFETAPEMVTIAYLHDTLEDTDVEFEDLAKEFGLYIANGVQALTNEEKSFGTRAQRKAADNARLSFINGQLQSIKLADILDNVPSMLASDPEFGKKYLLEKIETVSLLDKAHPVLLSCTIDFLNNLKKVHRV
jgi:(p)ppGpp synthase/HD superfamily hydrolase